MGLGGHVLAAEKAGRAPGAQTSGLGDPGLVALLPASLSKSLSLLRTLLPESPAWPTRLCTFLPTLLPSPQAPATPIHTGREQCLCQEA